ncbi:unnamed protein product [Adineta steineri]|uniref:G-protein coupled receptors family 1 profile domain-containing protein n=1 Tax=Adineta steineri TaxID=433720 RepID=A0A813MJX7_9BILA|nr:unnamed protein product [Adineta steineri]
MSLSNATMAEINALNYANEVFFLFWTFASIALGTVGHLLSIYVFTRPILRSNPCACYFLAATVTVFNLGPSIIMLIFGSLTIRHIQQSVRRVTASNNKTQTGTGLTTAMQEQLQRQKTIDRQLIRMMVAQSVYFAVLTTPNSVGYIYFSLTTNTLFNDVQLAQVNLFVNIAGLLSTTGACTTFYLFTLSSKLFRQELMRLFTWRSYEHPITIPTSHAVRPNN